MKFRLLCLGLCLFTFIGCHQETDEINDPIIEDIKKNYADMAWAVYADCYDYAVQLNEKIIQFTEDPTDQHFSEVKQAWLTAREIYGQTEIFRFAEGPIDNASDGPEGLINSWPMDEAYVDYVQGNQTSGIINNPTQFPTINITTLVGLNELGGETNISTGFHAIEFLLWGQDLDPNGPGNRPFTDFVDGGTALNQDRRRAYLKTLGEILVMSLEKVKNEWDPSNNSNYRYYLIETYDNDEFVHKYFNSFQVLSGIELAGERVYVAYFNANQEDEHSCFSDNTHRDIALNAKAIQNLYYGTYQSPLGRTVSGKGLNQYVQLFNKPLNAKMEENFNAVNTAIAQMYQPFDQAIVLPEERPKVLEVVHLLEEQRTIFLEIAKHFGQSY